MSDQLVARPLPTQDNTTKTDEDKHPCLKRDSNPRYSVRAIKARASDRAATGSAICLFCFFSRTKYIGVVKDCDYDMVIKLFDEEVLLK
jgi:hypothetical protein